MSTNPTPSAAEPRDAVKHMLMDGPAPLCGLVADLRPFHATTDPAAVTCPECKRLMEGGSDAVD